MQLAIENKNNLIDYVSHCIAEAEKAENNAWEYMRAHKYRPEAEAAFVDASVSIRLAIERLEQVRVQLWNNSAGAGSAHYAHKAGA